LRQALSRHSQALMGSGTSKKNTKAERLWHEMVMGLRHNELPRLRLGEVRTCEGLGKPLWQEEIMQWTADTGSDNPSLEEFRYLDFSNGPQKKQRNKTLELAHAISQNKSVQCLHLRADEAYSPSFSALLFDAITHMVPQNPYLSSLTLSMGDFFPVALGLARQERISAAIRNLGVMNGNLTELSITHANLGNQGALALVRIVVESSANLHALSLAANGLTEAVLPELATLLTSPSGRKISRLGLADNPRLGDGVVGSFTCVSWLLSECTHLRVLDLRKTCAASGLLDADEKKQDGTRSWGAVADVLTTSKLQRLFLSMNVFAEFWFAMERKGTLEANRSLLSFGWGTARMPSRPVELTSKHHGRVKPSCGPTFWGWSRNERGTFWSKLERLPFCRQCSCSW
jgi:hypothetical protein